MSRTRIRDCKRCVIGSARAHSDFCTKCSATIDRIIGRAIDGDVADEVLAAELELSVDALQRRRRRIKAKRSAEVTHVAA